MWPAQTSSHGLPALSRVWQHVTLSDVCLGTHPRYSLVVDEDVKKRNKQTIVCLLISLCVDLRWKDVWSMSWTVLSLITTATQSTRISSAKCEYIVHPPSVLSCYFEMSTWVQTARQVEDLGCCDLCRPATDTDFIRMYRFFYPENLRKYRFSSLKFGKLQIFLLKIWQNTEFFQAKVVFFLIFPLVIQIFPPKYWFSLSFMLILWYSRVAGLFV